MKRLTVATDERHVGITDAVTFQRQAAQLAQAVWALHPEWMGEVAHTVRVLAEGRAPAGAAPVEAAMATVHAKAGEANAGAGVAIIPIRGVITQRGDGFAGARDGAQASVERISAMLRQAMADPNVGAVIYDMDTPGGVVTGVQELADEMRVARNIKPSLAIANGMSASAGYWLMTAASEVSVIPSGEVGSIGVYTMHMDVSKALAYMGIQVNIVRAGKFKIEANPFEPLSEEARAYIQGRVEEHYANFLGSVAKGRGVSLAKVRGGFGEGRMLGAPGAKAEGMVDRVETFDAALARVLRNPSRVGARAEDGSIIESEETNVPAPTPAASDEVETRKTVSKGARRFAFH